LKPFILITGMHRSGTSFLARALNLRGVYLGDYADFNSDDWRPAMDNPRGHWENKKFLEIAEKTLAINKGSWENIPENIKINKKIGNEIKGIVDNLKEKSPFAYGIKDPRILLFLDSWEKYLPKDFFIIGIFRHPLKVSESLKKRDQFSYEKSLIIWKLYNESLLKNLSKFDGFLLNFDWPKKKILYEIDLISKKIGLSTRIDISDWYTKELFKSDLTYKKDYPLNDEISELYSKLKKRAEQNDKVKIKINFSKNVTSRTIDDLLLVIQRNDKYFKKLVEKTLYEIQTHKKIVLDISQNLQEKEAEITIGKDYTSKLKNDLQEKEAEIIYGKDYISKLKNDLQEKEAEITNGKDYISKLKNDLQEKEAEIIYGKDYTSKLKNDLQEKESDISKGQEYVSKLVKEISDKNEEIKKLEGSLDEIKENLRILVQNRPKYYSNRL